MTHNHVSLIGLVLRVVERGADVIIRMMVNKETSSGDKQDQLLGTCRSPHLSC